MTKLFMFLSEAASCFFVSNSCASSFHKLIHPYSNTIMPPQHFCPLTPCINNFLHDQLDPPLFMLTPVQPVPRLLFELDDGKYNIRVCSMKRRCSQSKLIYKGLSLCFRNTSIFIFGRCELVQIFQPIIHSLNQLYQYLYITLTISFLSL